MKSNDGALMKVIRSLQNSQIQQIRTLRAKKQERHAKRKFVAEGFSVCKTLCESGQLLLTLFVTHNNYQKALLLTKPDRVIVVAEHVAKAIAGTKQPSGYVALFQMPPVPEIETFSGGLVCVQLSDPGNLGTLIRTAVAFNVFDIVCIAPTVDPWSSKVIRATAGTIGHARIFVASWEQVSAVAKQKALSLYAMVVEHGVPLNSVVKNEKRCIVVGNEAHGISQEIKKDCLPITLAMYKGVESLNVAVAGAIALYALSGQDKESG